MYRDPTAVRYIRLNTSKLSGSIARFKERNSATRPSDHRGSGRGSGYSLLHGIINSRIYTP